MNIKQKYKDTTELSIQYECMNAFAVGWLTAKFEKQLEAISDNTNIRLGCSGITVYPANRKECVTLLQIFGGKWDKSIEEYYKDKIRYTQLIACPFYDEMAIVISQAPPPASCRIEEVEELVPASVRKVKKMVCPAGIPDEADVETDPSVATEDGTI